jgi:Dynamin central region
MHTCKQVAAVLQNERKPLRLGYAMVRNRTQCELAAGVTLQQPHAAEQSLLLTVRQERVTLWYRCTLEHREA